MARATIQRRRAGSRAGALFLCAAAALVLAACGGEGEKAQAPSELARARPKGGHPPFTVRGRWPDPEALTWRVESGAGAIPNAEFRAIVERAVKVWNDTGLVRMRPAKAGELPTVTLGWRAGEHDRCPPFMAWEGAVAHAGPVEHGTFIHFDREARWKEEGASGRSIFQTALHEIGHVLGLGHPPCADAIMYMEYSDFEAPQPADLFGLQTLYGGGEDAPGDVAIVRIVDGRPGERTATLRRVLLPGRTELAAIDNDDDRRCELFVWRTDAEGTGAMWSYRFNARLQVEETVGPKPGITWPRGYTTSFRVTTDGRAIMIRDRADGRYHARLFHAKSRLPTMPWPTDESLELTGGGKDSDGDGTWEEKPPGPVKPGMKLPAGWAGWTVHTVADLDGVEGLEAVLVR